MITEFQNSFIELLEQSDVPAHSIDKNGYIVCVSNGWLNLLGYTRDEVVGRQSIDFLTDKSKEIAKSALREFYQKGKITGIQYTFLKKSGEEIQVLLNARSITTDSGEFVRSTAILSPINLDTNDQLIRSWIGCQSHDVKVLLQNLVIKVNNEGVIIECPNVHWFDLIGSFKNKFVNARFLELSVPQTGDFQIIEIPEQTPHTPEPILQLKKSHTG